MKSQFARTLLLLGALFSAGVLISVVGTRARMHPGAVQPPPAFSADTAQQPDNQLTRRAANPLSSPFDFRAASAAALRPAAFAPAVVTTIVNYDFNTGASYDSLTPLLASGVLSGASSTEPFQTFSGTATTAAAFTANATAGNAVAMNNSSGTNTRYFQFTLGGSALAIYNSYKVYVQAQRSGTGAPTLTLAYSTDGTNFTNLGATLTVPDGSFAAQVFDLSAIGTLNHQGIVVFRLLASGASGTGTLRIDNFQVQANSVPLAGSPSVAGNKTATLATDVNGNGFINPGDTLMYSVVVSNGGADAMNVVFTDQLSPNLTLIGTANASPIGVNDSYDSLGNVGLNVPDGAGDLLSNDVDPNGNALTITGIPGCADVTAPFVCTTANGGNLTVQANGAFTYNSAPGFEGGDFFAYTVSDGQSPPKTDTANVTINVNEVIWFVDNSQGSNGDGRLGTPFNSLPNFVSGAADDPGDVIFLYRQAGADYTGPLTLLADQKLIGQGSTASLAASFTPNLTIPPFSNTLPATGGTRPNLRVMNNGAGNHNLTISTGNTLRGFNLESNATGGNATGSALFSTSFNNLTLSEVSVTSSAGMAGNCSAAVNLDQSSGTAAINATFTSVSANSCTGGIILADTTGSFTVTGNSAGLCGGSVTNTTNPAVAATVTAPNTADCTGGTIQNTTADGIRLNNVQNVSLTRMYILNGATNGIFGTNVNGFQLLSSYLFNNGNNSDEVGLKFTDVTNPGTQNGLIGTALAGAFPTRIINSTVRQSGEFNVEIVNRSGTLTDLLVDGSQFTDTKLNAGPTDADGFNVELQGTSVGTVRFTNSFFSGNLTQGAQVSAIDSASLTTSVKSSTFTNNNEGFICNHSGSSDLDCTVGGDVSSEGNHFRGQPTEPVIGSGALIVTSSNSLSTASASNTTKIKFNNVASPANQVNHAVIAFMSGTGANRSVNVSNNTVSNLTFGHAIFVDTPDNPSTTQFSVTANNNTVTNNAPGGHGVLVQARQGTTGCALIQNNTGTVDAGSSVARARAAGTTTPTVQNATLNLKQGVSASMVAATVIQDNNPGATTSVSTGTNGTINVVANGACTTPAPLAPPIETEEQLRRQSGNSAQQTSIGNTAPNFLARLNQWLKPVFTAFSAPTSYVTLERAFDRAAETVAPTATAAEFVAPPIGGSDTNAKLLPPEGGTTNIPARPARTMLVNSRGEYRIVPTAALSGELITINGTGGGFTLPAGESTTVMFNAQISAAFTGTSIANQATVMGGNFATVMSNNLMTEVFQPVTITKIFSPAIVDPPSGASSLNFTITNPNPTAQTMGAVADVLTGGLTATNGMSSVCGGANNLVVSGTNTITLTGATVPGSSTCMFSVTVTGTTEGLVNNTSGNVSTLQGGTGGTAANSVRVVNPPTLSKTFQTNPIPINTTSQLQFTLTNPNTTLANSNLSFTDSLPSILSAANVGPTTVCTDGSYSITGNVITFNKPSLAAGASCVFDVTVTGVMAGSATNTTSTVTTSDSGAGAAATAPVSVVEQADLAVTKTDAPDPVLAGNNITYTINFSNNGPTQASSVTVTDATPANTTFVSATVTTGMGWTPTTPAVGGTGNVVFSKGTVANAETAVFTIVVKVDPGTASGATITNTATAASTTSDPTPANNSATATTTVNTQADVFITKTDGATTEVPGSTVTYTIVAANAGPSTALGVTVSDTFPGILSGCSTTSAAAGGATGNDVGPTAGNISDGGITLPPGAMVTYMATCTIAANATGTLDNTATITTATTDPTPGNNSSTDSDTLTPQADLSVTKTDAPDPVLAGNNITYTINFSSAGPSDASTVTVTDAVPANTTFVSASVTTGTGWTPTMPAVGGTGNVVFSKATVTAAETAVFSIVVKVNSSATGSISNTAAAAATTTDPTPANDSATAMTTVNTQADLAVTKSDAPDPVFAGSNITYTINFSNAGPSDASTVTVTDAVPANTTFVSATVTTGTGWTPTTPAVGGTGNVVFSKASVANAETAVFAIVVNVNVSTPHNTTITNTATAASTTTDPTPANNSATTTTTAQASADLAVTKSDSPDPVSAGANITYTINLVNNGPTAAGTVTVTDAVPANTTFVSAAVTTGTGWTPTTPAVGGTGNVVFSKASVANAETAVFTVVVKVNSNTASGATITNTATAASATGDPTPANNSATATTTVNTQADLAVTKTDSPDPVIAGNNITYTINFTNNGPSDASTATVTDAVPANTTFVSASVTTGAGWGTSAPAVGATGNVVFSKATVTAAETAVFSIVVKVNSSATGTISNTATAATATTDPTPANNSATATTTVNTQADLAVTKTDSPDPVTAGQNITYTINFNNNGPSDASTVTVTDAVPANTTFVSATVTTGTGWSTSAPAVGATGNVVFSKASVANAQTAVFTIVVKVNNGFSGTVTNTATAASATTDPTPANNSATATTTAFAPPTIAKVFSPTSVVAGSNTTITLTLSNSNASQLTNASFTDTLTNMSAVGGAAGGSCVGASSNVLAANATNLSFSGITIPASSNCTVTFSVKANAGGTLPNTTSGVTTAQTTVAGAPSNTANLTVTCPTIDLTPKPAGPVGGSAYPLPATTVGANYTPTNTVITAAPAGGNYTFTVIAAPNLLPPGLSLSPSPNSVQIVGTPTAAGIYVFRIQATGFGTCTGLRLYSIRVNAASFAARAVRNDFDGDGKSDPALWRNDLGEWRIVLSSTGELQTVPLVEPSEPAGKMEEYLPAAADFDGDQKTDAAVWRVRDGRWLIKRSADGELLKARFGQAGDTPVPADYDSDGRSDFALWRNATGSWHILRSSEQAEQIVYLGAPGDMPVAGDYDGDGLLDLAVFRASDSRWLLRSAATGALSEERFGQAGDLPLAADYDGDGLTDLAVWRQAEGFGYVRRSLDQETQRVPWGRLQVGEWAVSGDYDGDARADLAIWRVAKAAWDILLGQ